MRKRYFLQSLTVNRNMRIFFLTFILSVLFFSMEVKAQTLDSEWQSWSVFSIVQDGEKICYITSSPTNQAGNYKRRSQPYFLVTYRGKNVSEISVSSGYPYKAKSKVNVSVDGKTKYKLFTTSETPKIAWAKNTKEDKRIVASMKKGINLTAKGTSRLGTFSKDTYSLMGFTKAYNRMKKLCK